MEFRRGKKPAASAGDRPTHLAGDAFADLQSPGEEAPAVMQPPTLGLTGPLLSSDRLRAVRLNRAEEGYHIPEVDDLLLLVIHSMRELERRAEAAESVTRERDQELDDQAQQVRLLQSTIEIFRANDGSPVVNAEGEYLTESQVELASRSAEQARAEAEGRARQAVEESDRARRELAAAQDAAEEAHARRASVEESLASTQQHAAALAAYVETLQAWAASVSAQQQQTDADNEQRLAAAYAEITRLQDAYEALALSQVQHVPETAPGTPAGPEPAGVPGAAGQGQLSPEADGVARGAVEPAGVPAGPAPYEEYAPGGFAPGPSAVEPFPSETPDPAGGATADATRVDGPPADQDGLAPTPRLRTRQPR